MEYSIGKPGRIVAARLFEGEDLYESLEGLAQTENIHCAAVLITGGIRTANVVVGPKQEQPTLIGDMREFTGPGEVLGVGTIYLADGKPTLHLHAGLGRGQNPMIGCPRGGAKIFLILEVTIIEITGIDAKRTTDPKSGLKLLRIQP